MCYNISVNNYSGDFFAMSNYKFGAKGEGKGKVVYNAGIINGIVALAINEVEGVRLVSGKRRRCRKSGACGRTDESGASGWHGTQLSRGKQKKNILDIQRYL